ncbi:MAG: hypothetical protein BWY71_01566 [Planctomycetes bacterium ADurb.Bin412]|nr:MAG: hypothetical protein BWY71_01566 [Planctomycetes bacterium ADurb.Bin412]
MHVALRPQCDNVFLRHRRHRPRHAMITLDFHRIGIIPDFRPIVQRQTPQDILLLFPVIIEDIHPARQHRRSRMPLAQLHLPQNRRTARRPVHIQGNGFRADTVKIAVAKTRPTARQAGGLPSPCCQYPLPGGCCLPLLHLLRRNIRARYPQRNIHLPAQQPPRQNPNPHQH